MGDRTGIEWTDSSWNPVTGCDKVSPGCDHCYAETMANRFAGTKAYPDGFKVTLRPERLDQPLRWKRPRRIFVNSMSDLFHKDIPDEYIAKVWAVMALAPQHSFQILTKRHGRMRSLLNSRDFQRLVADLIRPRWQSDNKLRDQVGWPFDITGKTAKWPLRNVWLGVSVEDQQRADLRIPALLDTPAAVRFLSCEPLLGPVDLTGSGTAQTYWLTGRPGWGEPETTNGVTLSPLMVAPRIDWVICGGESGRGARPMHPEWARQLRDQCVAAGVPYLFKQWGEWSPNARNHKLSQRRFAYESVRFRPNGVRYSATSDALDMEVGYSAPGMTSMLRVGKRAAGRELDGVTHDGYPEAHHG